jgi:hypothetical protein
MEPLMKAQVIDSRHLELKRPINNAPGSTMMITIEHDKDVAEGREWYLLSSRSLEEAYGESEPDYSLKRIKTPNPEYQP